ncbi:hypothetical protein [Porphyromonas asaccharolytica]|uniref:hypothetical protein n=1 Tax=Porphyromonas asaccharolytica TaxID=28123 RepID=UPI00248D9240|nr:hypothetical protein [Porphyromonas asaccharolytica]
MTNLQRLLATLTAILCVTLAMSSCDPKQEPNPGVDTTGVTPQPDPQPFQSILELDANGELTAIPFPCVDWLGGEKAVQAFEQSKGATLDGTIDKNGKKVLRYKTGDPKGQQPIRLYIIDPAKAILETSSIQIAAHLVAEGDDINDNMEILLSDAGYQKVPEAKGIAYSNGTYLLVFSKVNDSSWAIAYKSAGDPAQLAGILQIKDFPYLKKETKMSAYTFEEIEAYEKQLGLRKQTSKTKTSVTYQAIDPSKVNFTYVRYDIDPNDEGKSGPIVRTDRFTMAMYKQPELRSYFELNGFTYEGAFQNYAEKFVNKDLAVRLRLSDKRPGAIITFEDAPDLYHKGPKPGQPTFQALYLPLLDVFGQKISKESPIIDREREIHPDCDIEFKPANPDAGYKHDAIKVSMPLSFKLDPADRNKPRAVSYSYESLSGSTIEQITYVFSQDWAKAKIAGDNALIKDFMTKNGFSYKGKDKIDDPRMTSEYYQYYNAQLGIYFEYSLVSKPMPSAMGVYTKTPVITF